MGPAPAVAATRLAVRRALIGLDRVLVACSGGPDSVALAAAVAFEAPRAGVTWTLVTVDHGLQPGSAEQARRVEELGRTLSAGAALASTLTIAVHVGHDGGPEGAAREARYAALRRLAGPPPNKSGGGRRGTRVLLGHTRDDQAETVLLGLGRGSGPRSIAGMRRVDGPWIRPFLGLDRATTVAACAAQDLPVWHDPHNDDGRFVRVRLRREVLPLLEDVLHGGVAASLARTADLLRDDLDALDAWAEHAYRAATTPASSPPPSAPSPPPSPPLSGDQLADLVADRPDRLVDHRAAVASGVPSEAADRVAAHGSRPGEIHVAALAGLPPAIRARVLRRWASHRGAGPLTAAHTAALDALVTAWDGQGPAFVPGGVVTRTRSGTLDFVPKAQQPPQQE